MRDAHFVRKTLYNLKLYGILVLFITRTRNIVCICLFFWLDINTSNMKFLNVFIIIISIVFFFLWKCFILDIIGFLFTFYSISTLWRQKSRFFSYYELYKIIFYVCISITSLINTLQVIFIQLSFLCISIVADCEATIPNYTVLDLKPTNCFWKIILTYYFYFFILGLWGFNF